MIKMKLDKKYQKWNDEAMKKCKIVVDLHHKIDYFGSLFYIRDMFIASLYDLQKLEKENRRLRRIIQEEKADGKNKIPFNEWSKKAIKKGHKFMTSRHKKYLKDTRVKTILPKTEWGFIRDNYWWLEGAESPEELQQIIESIYKRKVEDNEMFFPHIGDYSGEEGLFSSHD